MLLCFFALSCQSKLALKTCQNISSIAFCCAVPEDRSYYRAYLPTDLYRLLEQIGALHEPSLDKSEMARLAFTMWVNSPEIAKLIEYHKLKQYEGNTD